MIKPIFYINDVHITGKYVIQRAKILKQLRAFQGRNGRLKTALKSNVKRIVKNGNTSKLFKD